MSAPLTAADRAVTHLLRQMQGDGMLAYLIGYGSRSFEMLTEAYSERTGEDLETVRRETWANCAPVRIRMAED